MRAFLRLKKSLFLFSLVLLAFCASAQQPAPVQDSTAKKQINIIHADKISFKKTDSLNEYQILVGHVAVQQEKTLFYCDSASNNTKTNVLESFGKVHINDNDSLHIYSNYLKYLGKEKKATLTGDVRLTDGKGTLTTSKLDYDLNTHIGNYYDGGKVVNGKTVLTSKEGFYYEDTRDVYFKKEVVLIDPDYTIKTDTLLYNTYTGVATFVVPTTIISDSGRRVVKTKDGYYDTKNKKTYFGQRTEIQDGSLFIIADEMASDDSTGFGEARGKVIFRDTAQKVTILANHLNSNRKNNSFLATEKPVMIIEQGEGDSLFVAADTMYSARLSELRKYRNVPVIVESAVQQKSDTAVPVKKIFRETIPANDDSTITENDMAAITTTDTIIAKDSTVLAKEKITLPKTAVKDSIQKKPDYNSIVKSDSTAVVSDTVVVKEKLSGKHRREKDTALKPAKDSLSFKNLLLSTDSTLTKNDTLIRDTAVAIQDSVINTADPLARQQMPQKLVAVDTVTNHGNDSTDRFYEAYYHVRIFSDSLQAKCDSLFYSGEDSAFRMFKQPIVWARESQITGDTIYLFTQNKKPQRLFVFENAFTVNKVGTSYFNQIKGRTINGYFKNGNIDFMRAKGSSETIYYAQDEYNKFVGVNKASADITDMYFEEKKPMKVVFRSGLVGTMYPMRQVNHDELRLRGYQWLEDLRPKSKYELFAD